MPNFICYQTSKKKIDLDVGLQSFENCLINLNQFSWQETHFEIKETFEGYLTFNMTFNIFIQIITTENCTVLYNDVTIAQVLLRSTAKQKRLFRALRLGFQELADI